MAEENASSTVQYRSRRWSDLLVILSLLILWELLYYLGLADPVLLSHPMAIFKTFRELEFLANFSGILILLALGLLPGLAIGVFLGTLIGRIAWLTQAALSFFRIGLWLPVLTAWALPIWPLQKGREFLAFFLVLTVSVTAVSLFTCYHYLTARFTLGLRRHEVRRLVVRLSILHALFVSLISQMWMSRWEWLFHADAGGSTRGYAALIMLLIFLFVVNLVFRSAFDQTATVRATVLLREIEGQSQKSIWVAVLLSTVCLVVWQFLSVTGWYSLISSPLDAFRMVYRLLVIDTGIPKDENLIWGDIGVSLVELLGGLILGGGVAIIVFNGLVLNQIFRVWVFPLLPLTYILPVILPVFTTHWSLLVATKQTAVGVAGLTFFPFLHILWGLRDRPLLCRILLAADEALPFAFVAMLFGEAWTAVAGLGFFMVVVRHITHDVTQGIAASLITIALLVVISSTLRWLVKRLYFPAGSQL